MGAEKQVRTNFEQVESAGLAESLSPEIIQITRDGYLALAALQQTPQCMDTFRKAVNRGRNTTNALNAVRRVGESANAD